MLKNIDIIGVSDVLNIPNIDHYIYGSHRAAYKILNQNYDKKVYKYLKKDIRVNENIELFDHKNIKYVNNEVVLLDICPSYYHFMVDVLGKFLYINQYNPNVIPFFISTDGLDNNVNRLNKQAFKEILEIFSKYYNIEYSIDLLNNKTKYIFDKVYSIDGPGKMSTQSMHGEYLIYNLLREMFLPKRESMNNRNIFISRKNIFARKIKSINSLEKLFIDKGYEVVFFEEMTFSEQVNAVYDSKNIASITGSSLTNILFANPKANIMSVNVEVAYDCYEWKDIANALNINYMDFYISTHDHKKIFKVFNILEELFND